MVRPKLISVRITFEFTQIDHPTEQRFSIVLGANVFFVLYVHIEDIWNGPTRFGNFATQRPCFGNVDDRPSRDARYGDVEGCISPQSEMVPELEARFQPPITIFLIYGVDTIFGLTREMDTS